MLLDFKTLSFMVMMSSILYAITIAFFASLANQYKGITLYMWGAICAAIGFFLMALVSFFPELLIIRLISGFFLLFSTYLYFLGIARFLDFTFSARPHIKFFILGIVLYTYVLSPLAPNGIIKGMLFPVYLIFIYSCICYLLWQRRNCKFSSSLYFVLCSAILMIFVFAHRCYTVFIYHIESSIESTSSNNGLLLAVFISGYFRNVGFIMMVSQRLYQDLRETALQDFLTQTHNRRAMKQFLIKEFNLFQRFKTICSLILLDVDYFKMINDKHGHEVGDKVLQDITTILKENLRETDSLGRWGGEEFLVILPNTHLTKAAEVAEKLRLAIATESISGLCCTISLGVKMLDIHDRNIDEAVKRADDALYQAKAQGRNRVCVFSDIKS